MYSRPTSSCHAPSTIATRPASSPAELRPPALALIAALLCTLSFQESAHAGRDEPNSSGLRNTRTPLGTVDPREQRTMHLVGVQSRPDGTARIVEVHGIFEDGAEVRIWEATGARREARIPVRELVGLHFSERHCPTTGPCMETDYRIVDSRRDTKRNHLAVDRDNRDVWLFVVEFRSVGVHERARWKNVCRPASDGRRDGIFLGGRWRSDGAWIPDGYTFACTDSAIAKCARDWGYKPWQSRPAPTGEMVHLRSLHLACVRAVRADYCGDGATHTRDGTLIDLFDSAGLVPARPSDDLVAEAVFDRHGARRILRTRWPTTGEGAMPAPSCARTPPSQGRASLEPVIHVRSAVPPRIGLP